ncbi:unnamed protein product [Lampetra planeri]
MKFPMALPLVMPDLEMKDKYKVMLPLLSGNTIKWEAQSGVIVENNLFISPFRLILAVRLGTNSRGKSTILNQLLSVEHLFSSCGEPGAHRGPPQTLAGTVEFTWLTQETCGAGLWESVLKQFYARGKNEIVLLANLHGDASEYPEVIQFLKEITSTCADCTVAQDLLQVMMKFPMALPLVMPDLEVREKYKVMLPLLSGNIIKWEAQSGVIVENNLFISAFRLILAVRLGTNSLGKSTILNQLMSVEHLFSSCGEPGAHRGPPLTLAGTVEFTWLTQETCGAGLWESVLKQFYARGENEIVLLANLHGDASEYPEIIQFLKKITSTIHNNDAEDRIWDFRCKETFDVSRPVSSFATSYVNNFDEKLDFTCPFNSIVSGIGSYHSNDAEDRRWKFTCTMQANVCMGACQWTDYLNDFDAPMFWVTPDSRYLVGAHSYHSNDAEDRRWKFQFCTKAAC